jgi:hypothetical protein
MADHAQTASCRVRVDEPVWRWPAVEPDRAGSRRGVTALVQATARRAMRQV